MYYNLNKFGKKLIEMRQTLGYSQNKISKLSGVNTATLRRIENGKVIPKYETLVFLSPVFKKDLNKLLLKYKFNDYSKFNETKNRMESKLDKDEFLTLDTELNDFKNLLSNTENPHSKILINQLILLIESIMLNKGENKKEEALKKLTEAVKASNPEFSMSNYGSLVYSSIEIRLLMNIALLINKMKSTEKSLEILEFCFEIADPNESIYPKICYNLSYTYHRLDDHENALRYASLGIEYCFQQRNYNGLNLLYFREGIAKFLLNHDDYMSSLRKALNQCNLLKQYNLADTMIHSCKNYYNIDL